MRGFAMPLPIPLGTLLQNRYSLIDLLGQGSLGRTYLAKDQERSNELCIIQEVSVPTGSGSPLTYEQFREQAFNLFRIRHPQVPQYRTTFEQDHRLFVVRDYVEGVTYQVLLDRRRTVGETFQEAEVIQLLLQVLPALEYLHEMGISHGQVAPENIVWPADPHSPFPDYPVVGPSGQPPLPVLINIGVVEEWVYRLTQNPMAATLTLENKTVSKDVARGDLYALAVTALVLLTGKEPQQLLDPATQHWNWQSQTKMSPALAKVLDRMLSENPEMRYQNAAEVAAALIFLEPIAEVVPAERQVAKPSETAPKPRKRGPVAPRPPGRKPWLYLLSLALIIISGLVSWAVVKYFLFRLQPVSSVSSPTPAATSTSTPSVTPATLAAIQPVPVSLPLNEPKRLEGTLQPGQIVVYQLSGQPWQQLNVTFTDPSKVSANLFNTAKEPIAASAKPGEPLNGLFSAAGSYFLQVSSAAGASSTPYQIQVRLTDYFPRKLCESPNLEQSATWYPVLIQYSRPTLEQVQQQNCRDTVVIPQGAGKTPLIQVGAFQNRQQAEALATLMQRQAGSGQVGEPVSGSPRRSCGDVGGAQTGYPVLMTYSKEAYIQILALCPEASVVKQQSQDYIEVARFVEESKAKELATFMTQEVSQAEVGPATTDSDTEEQKEAK
jgi:serine/threonine protein kinase